MTSPHEIRPQAADELSRLAKAGDDAHFEAIALACRSSAKNMAPQALAEAGLVKAPEILLAKAAIQHFAPDSPLHDLSSHTLITLGEWGEKWVAPLCAEAERHLQAGRPAGVLNADWAKRTVKRLRADIKEAKKPAVPSVMAPGIDQLYATQKSKLVETQEELARANLLIDKLYAQIQALQSQNEENHDQA